MTGYKVYIGRSSRTYDRVDLVPSPPYPPANPDAPESEVLHWVENLGVGEYFFTVSAYNDHGESAQAGEVSTTFPSCGLVRTMKLDE